MILVVSLLFFSKDGFGFKYSMKVGIPLNKEIKPNLSIYSHIYLSPSYGLNSITAVFLQGWFGHQITYKGWYAIKQRNQTKAFLPYFF